MATANESIIGRALWYCYLLYVVSLGTMKPTLAIAGQRSAPGDLIFVLALVLCLGAVAAGKIKFLSHSVSINTVRFVAAMNISLMSATDVARCMFQGARHIWLLVGLIPAASAISKEQKRFAAWEDLRYS